MLKSGYFFHIGQPFFTKLWYDKRVQKQIFCALLFFHKETL